MSSESMPRRESPLEAFLTFLRATGFLVTLGLLSPLPAHAYSWYSGASVGSDGTVYGWGVTDATPPHGSNMSHVAYVTTTLTSPIKRRQASNSLNLQNMVRADVSLSFDPGDLGSYQDYTTSSAFCYSCLCYFIYGAVSQAFANNAAYPVNFTQSGSTAYADGRLQFYYTWGSSSRNIMDLADCVVYEAVTYPGPPGTFVLPKPPWNYSQPNPSVGPVPKIPGSNGTGGDTQYPGTFATPYGNNQFDATQVYEYSCPAGIGDLATGITIHRQVQQNGSYYTYQVTKSGASSSCTLGVNCYQ